MREFFISDTHFLHNKEFIYADRGFSSIEEMDEALIENWNSVVSPEDTVYHLGDLFLGTDLEAGGEILRRLNGHIHLITGNHDTERKLAYIKENIPNIESIQRSEWIKRHKRMIVLSHYPVITTQAVDISQSTSKSTLCFFGHTHQKTNFINGLRFDYHVGVDSHNLTPVDLETALTDIKEHWTELYRQSMNED